MTPADCFVCAKQRGELTLPGGAIYQDALLSVGHAAPRAATPDATYLGWLVVETRRHAPGLADLQPAEAEAVGAMAAHLARALRAVVGAEHVYAFVLGDHVPHFHEHVVARYPGAPPEFWGLRVDDWPDAPRGDAAAIVALCDRLRAWLASTR